MQNMNRKNIRIYAPLIIFFLLLFIYLMDIRNLHTAARSILVCLTYAVLAAETARLITAIARKKAPGIPNTAKRFGLIALYGLLAAFPVSYVEHVFTFYLGGYKSLNPWDTTFIAGLQIMCTLLVVCAYEGLYYMENWKLLFAESEKMKESNLFSQYNFLKNQIKPHFLFNSLNTLSSIIVTDPLKAERFVEEMSSVYRYLLKKNEKDLTTLQEELNFLDSYILLLKTRFEEALQVKIDVPPRYEDYLLPPLVLQLLIENAVKHNVVSREKPLTVDITVDTKNNLHICNNLQRKRSLETSEKTGLSNLMARYELLKMGHQLHIIEEDDFFKVIIPLIHDNIYAEFSA